MADPVGISLAALGTAQQCIQLATVLRQRYKDYVSAEHSLSEHILVLEYHAVTIENQISFLQSVWAQLEPRFQTLQNTLLHILYHKLQYAVELIDAAIGSKEDRASLQSVMVKRGSVRKLYFAFSLKKCLDKTVDDIQKWHRMFEPSWYLISRVSNRLVDASLRAHGADKVKSIAVLRKFRDTTIQQPGYVPLSRDLSSTGSPNLSSIRVIRGSDIKQAYGNANEIVIIDQFTPNERASLDKVKDEINKLANTLAEVDPTVFGLLECRGYLQRDATEPSQPPTFNLLFAALPNLFNPMSLRAKLMEPSAVSLNIRLALAQSLSNAVLFVHSSQFVHKNIRPETILIFESQTSTALQPFLLGFERFRTASGETFKLGESRWERDLYRHPQRQGLWPEEEYSMLHDVYSLGLVLLEIGLWTSFVTYSSTAQISPGPVVSAVADNMRLETRTRASRNKEFLVTMARDRLPCSMGATYAETVVSCLTCLDAVDPGLGDPDAFLDKDDVVVGVEFVESVIMKLHDISY